MSIARHTTYNLVGSVTAVAVSLITVPLYLQLIGIERFGILSICWLLLGYFGFFELGLGPATVQRISALAKASDQRRSSLMWTALPLSALVGAVGGLALYVAGEWILLGTRDLAPHYIAEIDRSMVWLAVAMPMVTTTAVLNGALQGRKRFAESSAFTTGVHTLTAVAPLITAATVSPQLPYLIATVAACRAMSLLLLFGICRRLVPLGKPVPPSLADMRGLASFGGWVAANGVITPILLSAEKVLSAWRLGPAAVSIYMVPYNLVSRFLLIPQSLYTALVPDLTLADAGEARAIETRAVAALCAIGAPICIAGIAVMRPFLELWVGPAIAEQSAPIGVILIAAMWCNACAYIPHARFQASGRPDLVTKISMVQLAPYLALLWIVLERWGLIGAALLWAARAFIEALVYGAVGRNIGPIVRAMLPGGLLVGCSALLGLLSPFGELTTYALQAVVLGLSALNLARAVPRRLWQSLRGRLSVSASS